MACRMPSDAIVLAGPHDGITVSGAGELATFLFELIPEWPRLPERMAVAHPSPNFIEVRGDAGGWHVSSPHFPLEDFELNDGYMVANGLIGALIAGYVAQSAELMCIHAGAVRVGDGLVLLLGDSYGGKSTFSTALAARGYRFFSDDRIVLDLSSARPAGRSLAIAPKLRLPLPEEADDNYRKFVDENSQLTWPEMVVLRPGPSLAAGFGEALPVKAVIQLLRNEDAVQPELTAMRQSAMVTFLLEQLFAPHLGLQGRLSACAHVVRSIDLFQLHYASAFAAAEAVVNRFGSEADA
jgi:hypothetical protein